MTAKLHKKLIFYVTLQNQCDETMKRWLRYIFHFDHLIIVLLALLLTFLVSLIFDVLGLKNPYLKSVSHNSLTETYYQYSSNEEEIATNDNIVIIDWGLNASRDHIAGLLEKIDSLEPVAVGLDAIFPNPSNSEIDQRLKDALGRMAHKVVLAQMTDDEGETVKTFFADSMGLHSGSIMLNIDNETIHTFSALQDGDSSMVAILNEMWNAHYGIDNTLELKESPITIDYAHNFEVINSEDIDDYADEIKDHIVLVGSVTAGVDVSRVPTQRAYMSGVEIHAACLETLHDMREYPRVIPFWVNLLLAFVLCYVMELLLCLIQTRLPSTKKPWAIFIKEWVKNSYLTNIVLLPLLAIMTIFMINATLNGRYYMLTFIFTAVVLVVESRNIYRAAIAAFRAKYKWKWLSKSLVPE